MVHLQAKFRLAPWVPHPALFRVRNLAIDIAVRCGSFAPNSTQALPKQYRPLRNLVAEAQMRLQRLRVLDLRIGRHLSATLLARPIFRGVDELRADSAEPMRFRD